MPPRKKAASKKKILITWKHSAIGRDAAQKKTIAALGLHRLNQSVTHHDTPAIRGMARKVGHLVEIEEL